MHLSAAVFSSAAWPWVWGAFLLPCSGSSMQLKGVRSTSGCGSPICNTCLLNSKAQQVFLPSALWVTAQVCPLWPGQVMMLWETPCLQSSWEPTPPPSGLHEIILSLLKMSKPHSFSCSEPRLRLIIHL